MMNDSMRVSVRIGSRVKLKGDESGRRGTITQIVSLTRDPLVNVRFDAQGEFGTQEVVSNYSMFELVVPIALQKGAR